MRSPIFLIVTLAALLSGCATYEQPIIFAPSEENRVRTFFVRGQAFAVSEGDDSFAITEVQRSEVAGREYVRVWILFKNRTPSEMLLEPQARFRIEMRDRKRGTVVTCKPELPSKILHDINQEKLVAMVALSIGGALQAAATQPTTIRSEQYGSPSTTHTVNDRDDKTKQRAAETASVVSLVDAAYENYSSAMNAGLLRRNTLVPDDAVHGFVYFPITGFGGTAEWDGSGKPSPFGVPAYVPKDLEFVLYLGAEQNAAAVRFAPIAGE